MAEKKENNDPERVNKKKTAGQRISEFINGYTSLPHAMKMRCAKQFGMALCIAVLTTIMIASFDSWTYAIGYAGALFVLWPAITIQRDFWRGKIRKETLLCTKVQHIPVTGNFLVVKGRYTAYFQTVDIDPVESRKYSFILAPEQKHDLSENLYYNIYCHEDNPKEVLAWENLGTVAET